MFVLLKSNNIFNFSVVFYALFLLFCSFSVVDDIPAESPPPIPACLVVSW